MTVMESCRCKRYCLELELLSFVRSTINHQREALLSGPVCRPEVTNPNTLIVNNNNKYHNNCTLDHFDASFDRIASVVFTAIEPSMWTASVV